ncbi:MAG: hypothetical protein R3E31_23145 [Chloroflexota bacterium]
MQNPIAWWRTLSQNPVYLREKGNWGKANPFYETIRRFLPFVISGVILLGLCTGSANPALFSGNDGLVAFWCFMCLPGILLSALTLFGSFMTPALTAPSISLELANGTWDILRATPLPTRTILLAKLFGSLARLRVFWWLLFIVSLFQGLLMACSITLAAGEYAIWGWLVGLSTVARPWLEVLFAAFTGMLFSTWTQSGTMALVGSYTAVVFFKLFNSAALWLGIATLLGANETILLTSTLGPTFVYGVATIAVSIGLVIRANRLEQHRQ